MQSCEPCTDDSASICVPNAARFPKELWPFVRLVRAASRRRWVRSIGAMILTGENRDIRRKACPSATLFTTNPIWIGQEQNPDLRSERPATNRLSHGTIQKPFSKWEKFKEIRIKILIDVQHAVWACFRLLQLRIICKIINYIHWGVCLCRIEIKVFRGKKYIGVQNLRFFRAMMLNIQVLWYVTVGRLANSSRHSFSSTWKVWRWRWRHFDLQKFSNYLRVDRTNMP